ncbi:unnamed protein product (mitochondrion) [Plasmodiophora brassicae]|uniref:Uncharacterized protein n=1 Tax=Plasmodiophora brassicae TaxID=37360 RepID=A0A0G4INS6_PLABS|nr:hypothetical protein PBRA_005577 [Plasmodiophora brassicae]SPR01926.1 unnamed protein product [Plasmodiophora brassicae]
MTFRVPLVALSLAMALSNADLLAFPTGGAFGSLTRTTNGLGRSGSSTLTNTAARQQASRSLLNGFDRGFVNAGQGTAATVGAPNSAGVSQKGYGLGKTSGSHASNAFVVGDANEQGTSMSEVLKLTSGMDNTMTGLGANGDALMNSLNTIKKSQDAVGSATRASSSSLQSGTSSVNVFDNSNEAAQQRKSALLAR